MANLPAVFSLFNKVNKKEEDSSNPVEGRGELMQELELNMDDESIVRLVKERERHYAGYESTLKQRQDESEGYWLGNHYKTPIEQTSEQRPLQDNIIFEAVETLLPTATATNPEPVVELEERDREFQKTIQEDLKKTADKQRMFLKLKKLTRHWCLYFMGAAKVGIGPEGEKEMTIVFPQHLILDPDATIDEGGIYTGNYIGHRRTKTASELVRMFPEKKEDIKKEVDGAMSTKVTYIEMWEDDKVFITYKDTVLKKMRNPHWNYSETVTKVDDFGIETEQTKEGVNHFASPQMPFVFLSVFNTGKHPHDDTSLVEQNLAKQDLANKRLRQIDRNADSQNNGIVLSGEVFTKEQAAQAADTLADGGYLWVPSGNIESAYTRDQSRPLPSDVFNQLADTRIQIKNSFGVTGLTPGGIQGDRTVRGKILTQSVDQSRIGGGITQYIEQVADRIYNWWYQLYVVYEAQGPVQDGVVITVKEGSLIPKDDITQRNEAIDLWSAGAMDPLTLFEKLDFPNPKEAVRRLTLWKGNPQGLIQDEEQTAPIEEETVEQPDLLDQVPVEQDAV